MNTLKLFIQISRPRFWLYLAGTYLVGFSFGINRLEDFYNANFIYTFLFFLFPANLFLYGVNDLFDQDTDILNPKKKAKEHLLKSSEEIKLKLGILISLSGFFIIYFSQKSAFSGFLLIIFILLSFIYSAPPFRLKVRPFLDFSSNILYAIPGFIGYYHASGNFAPFMVWIAAFFWTGAMHLFSSVPDIQADKKARLLTSAVYWGKTKTLIICCCLWLGFCGIVWSYNFLQPFSLLLIVYPLIPGYLIVNKRISILKAYWLFPVLNSFLGFIAFCLNILK